MVVDVLPVRVGGNDKRIWNTSEAAEKLQRSSSQ